MDNDSGVSFEEDKWKTQVPSFADETPKMVKLVMKISGGAITEQRQAEYVLFGFVIVAIITSLFVFFNTGSSNKQDLHTIYQEDLTPTARETIPKEVLDTIPNKK
ncbi:MAG: hypothetical protein HY507_00490 [Candidatus Zambryskibacteria bacterium]|nr:hypothetical protein [Candidatus Zambryskibacteria bacterium]